MRVAFVSGQWKGLNTVSLFLKLRRRLESLFPITPSGIAILEGPAAHTPRQLLSPEAERVLVDWIYFYAETANPLSRRVILRRAEAICGKRPGKSWLRSLLRRWPEITLGKLSGLNISEDEGDEMENEDEPAHIPPSLFSTPDVTRFSLKSKAKEALESENQSLRQRLSGTKCTLRAGT